MEAAYPVSLISHGQALNITCQSYAGTLNFGFIGDRDTVPHLQRLAVYTGDALKELEEALEAREKPQKVAPKAAKKASTKTRKAPAKKPRARPNAESSSVTE